MKTYTQLTRDKRYQMFVLLTFGARYKDVAEVLGVHKSTISREFKRNCPDGRYNPYRAQRLTNERRTHRPIRRRFRALHWRCIQALLQRQWSPEQIAARLRWEKRFAIQAPSGSMNTCAATARAVAVCGDIFAGAATAGSLIPAATSPVGWTSGSGPRSSSAEAVWGTGKATRC